MRRRGFGLTGTEELDRLRHRHRQHLGDVATAELELQHRLVEPLALTHVAGGLDRRHDAEVGEHHAGAVAVRARALGVRAEQRGLHAVGLGERLADRLQQTGVGRGVRPPRALDRCLVHHDRAGVLRHRLVDQRALARTRHTRDDGQHAERDVDVDVTQVVLGGATNLQHARSRTHLGLQRRPVVQVAPGHRVALAQPGQRSLEADRAAAPTGTGSEVDDVVRDRDRLGLVLDDENGVALVAQAEQQVVHALDVVRVQPDRGLVEHVGHVGQRGPEVPDHLHALRLTAGQRPSGTVQREIAETDLDEGVQRVHELVHQRRNTFVLDRTDPLGQVGDLHVAQVRDRHALDLGRPGGLGQPRATAVRTGPERRRAVHESADVRLQRLAVLGQHRLLQLRDQALVGQVDAVDLDLDRVLVQEVVQFLLGVLADRLGRVHEPGLHEHLHGPLAVDAVAGHLDRALEDRQRVVVDLGQVDVGDLAAALATRAHTAGDGELAALLDLLAALLDRHRTRAGDRGDVERERLRAADVRGAEAAVQDPQHGVDVGRGADGRARVGAHPLLVDEDRRGDALQQVHLGARQGRHEALDERAVGLVDQPLRLRGDGAEHQ